MSAGRVIGVAVDGSKTAEEALMWTAENIFRTGDTIVVIHAFQESVHPTPVVSDALEVTKAYKEEQQKIDNLLGGYENKVKALGKKCRYAKNKILHGKIGETILKMATEEKATMLVAGTRGHGAVKKAVLGSVSDWLIRNAEIPVIVFREAQAS